MTAGVDREGLRCSVVVPVYNGERTLGACLDALLRQSVPRASYELIVVDDGSRDASAQIVRGKGVRCIGQANRGPAAARNAGARASQGEIVLFTDADCVADEHWLEQMLRPFDDATVMGVQGAYRNRQRALAARFAQAEFEDRYDRLQKSRMIDLIATYAAAFRRQEFLDLGGFDERFPRPNNEDTEFSYRMAAAGHMMLFNPEAIVYHTHLDSLVEYFKLKFTRGCWRVVVYKHYPQKAIKDSYTPSVIKLQALLMALSFPLVLAAWFGRGFFLAAAACWLFVLLSSIPFAVKTFRKDPAVGLLSPLVVFLRALAFAGGSLLGIERCVVHSGILPR